MFSDYQQYIFNDLKKRGITNNAIKFYLELLELFALATNELKSTSKKLANRFGMSERSIQRYVKSLEEHHLISKKPIWNYDNPNKSYIEYNIYTPTFKSEELINKASHYSSRHKNVFFQGS